MSVSKTQSVGWVKSLRAVFIDVLTLRVDSFFLNVFVSASRIATISQGKKLNIIFSRFRCFRVGVKRQGRQTMGITRQCEHHTDAPQLLFIYSVSYCTHSPVLERRKHILFPVSLPHVHYSTVGAEQDIYKWHDLLSFSTNSPTETKSLWSLSR